MVHFSPYLAVLLPFFVLVVEPVLLVLDLEVVFYLYYFIMYFTYIFVFYCGFLRGHSFMGASDMTRDWASCWTMPLAFVQQLSLAGLVPRQLVLPWIRNDRHSVAWPCLPRSWTPSALLLRHSLSLLDCCCVPWFGTGCCGHLPPTLP